MYHTPYRKGKGTANWIGGLVAFIFWIIVATYIVISLPSADDTSQISNTKISRIEVLK